MWLLRDLSILPQGFWLLEDNLYSRSSSSNIAVRNITPIMNSSIMLCLPRCTVWWLLLFPLSSLISIIRFNYLSQRKLVNSSVYLSDITALVDTFSSTLRKNMEHHEHIPTNISYALMCVFYSIKTYPDWAVHIGWGVISEQLRS